MKLYRIIQMMGLPWLIIGIGMLLDNMIITSVGGLVFIAVGIIIINLVATKSIEYPEEE